MSGVNVRNLEKIQGKWLLFQRFVTSIVAIKSIPVFRSRVLIHSAFSDSENVISDNSLHTKFIIV